MEIRALTRCDNCDSDSDVLKEIVKKHGAARPLINPATPEQAFDMRASAEQMLKEFEGNSHLKAFVLEEGDCESIEVAKGTPCNYHKNGSTGGGGKYYNQCHLKEYSFESSVKTVDCD